MGVVVMSWVIARRQKTGNDYFLAGRAMGAVPLGASLLNLALALGAPWLSWLWWNPAGGLTTVAAGLLRAR